MKNKKISNEKGITLTVLIITIIVMIIIVGVSIMTLTDNTDIAVKEAFVTNMDIVKQKMVVVNKEKSLGSKAYDAIGIKVSSLSGEQKIKCETILSKHGKTNYENYIYYTSANLITIGIKNIEHDVIVGIDDNDVYSYTGVVINNVEYNSAEEIY